MQVLEVAIQALQHYTELFRLVSTALSSAPPGKRYDTLKNEALEFEKIQKAAWKVA